MIWLLNGFIYFIYWLQYGMVRFDGQEKKYINFSATLAFGC